MGDDLQGIKGFNVLGESIGRPFFLALEGPKDAVPNDENPAVVEVEIFPIGAMVDAVGRGRGEELLTKSERLDGFGVDPVLPDEVQASGLQDEAGSQTKETQDAVGHNRHQRFRNGLSEGSGEVVVL
ncbi:MAG: hypothetical protein WCO31_05605 [Actinomycetes bacterium]